MKSRAMPVVAVLVVAAAALAGAFYERAYRHPSHVTTAETDATDEVSNEFKEAMSTVQDSYAGEVDLEQLGKNSIQGMLRQLDPHSTFFTKAEYDEVQTEQNSRIYGIGVTIRRYSDRVYILSATPGGPGQRAGLRYGDAILAVDKENVEPWSQDQVLHKVRGEKGETVELTVERLGTPNPITVRIKRDEVKLPTVRNAFMVGQAGIGYIGLTGGFSKKTNDEVGEALTRLKEDGMRQLILDLRGNPGGLLDAAIDVCQKFLAQGQRIVEVRGRNTAPRIHEAPSNNQPETMPMVVLVNGHSASASEVVAGALQDHARAVIVGQNSFGKGLVQGVFNLWGGTGLVLTNAKYYTPSGRSIQRNYYDVSFYDYYLNRKRDGQRGGSANQGDAFYTDLGRAVYGGGGITPDIQVKTNDTGPLHNRLFNAVFDFVRQLVAGQVNGLRDYRIFEIQPRSKLAQEDINRYPITDELIAAFRRHIASKPQFNISDEQFTPPLLSFIRSQMRREIMTAAYGPEAGDQTYLSDDAQFRKAVESLDQARTLAENARRARGDVQ